MADENSPHGSEDHPFSGDQPIDSRGQDRFGRVLFAESLAAAISSWHGRPSLAIGIFGSWGAGKSSLKNMVVNALSDEKGRQRPAPLVVHFNPWWFSQRGSLTDAFFDQVGRALGGERDPAMVNIGVLLRRFPKYLRVGSALTGFVAEALNVVLISALILISFIPNSVVRIMSVVVVAILGTALSIWMPARNILNKLADLIAQITTKEPESLVGQRRALAASLGGSPRSILLVLDDVDRLTALEVREMLQLVKVNADFPNLVYLVLAERLALERSIEQDAAVSGSDFLSKIFQVQFDVPLPHERQVSAVLVSQLEQIPGLQGTPTIERRNRWVDIYVGGLLPYFKTIRDVHRFVGGLQFNTALLTTGGVIEVDHIDLIALETIRLFEPAVYARLRHLKPTLLSDHGGPMARHGEREAAKASVEGLIELAPEERRNQLSRVLVRLFPRVAPLVGQRSAFYDQDLWVRECRICADAFFDRYFALSLREDELSEADVAFLRNNMKDAETLIAHLEGIRGRGLLKELLGRLEAHKTTLPHDHAVPFLSALLAFGDRLEREPLALEPDAEMHLNRVVTWYLKQEPDPEVRAVQLFESIKGSGALVLAVAVLGMELDPKGRRRNPDARILEDGKLEEAQALALETIRRHASEGTLARSWNLHDVLFYWRDLGDGEGMRAWTSELLKTPGGVLTLLVGFVQKSYSHSAGEPLGRLHVRIYLGEVEKVVDMDELEEAVTRASGGLLGEPEAEAVEAYDRARRRATAGLPDSPRLDDDDSV